MCGALAVAHSWASAPSYLSSQSLADSRCNLHATSRSSQFESFGGFGKGIGEILWKAANVLQNKLTRAQYLDEVTWTTKNWLGRLQKEAAYLSRSSHSHRRADCE